VVGRKKLNLWNSTQFHALVPPNHVIQERPEFEFDYPRHAWDTPVNDHVSSYTLPRDLMTSSDGRIILGADGTFLLLFARDVPLHFGKQDKHCRVS